MMDVIGILVSFAFIFSVIAFAQFLLANHGVSSFTSRKIVHISVSHWWLIAMTFHESVGFALIGPISFVVLNAVSFASGMFESMEDPARRKNLGTIYFPISLIMLVLFTFGGPAPVYVGALATLVLGYGDGLASLIGYHYGRRSIRIFGERKSVEGSLTMLVASFLVSVIVIASLSGEVIPLSELLLRALAVSALAAAVELVTPLGLDNISVPVAVGLTYQAILSL
jgi:phytol kinase